MVLANFGIDLNLVWLAVFFWLVALTLLLIFTIRKYQRLIRGAGSSNLDKIVQKLVVDQEENRKETKLNKNALVALENKTKSHVQKVAIIRYNPFNQTGGNQSFSLVLLDGENNGIVVSSFHSREGTRLYTKNVTGGKTDGSFSKEEKEAIKQAISGKHKSTNE